MKQVLILTTTEGHLSLAQAASEALSTAKIENRLKLFEEPVFIIYRFYYRFIPFALGPSYRLVNSKVGMFFSHAFIRWQNTRRVKACIEETKPQVIISTSFGFQPVLDSLKGRYGFSYLTVIANPRTPFQSEFSPVADANLVFDTTLLHKMQAKYPHVKCQKLGWLVRSQFEADYDIKKVKKLLKLPPHQPVILFQAGSEGTATILRVLKQVCQHLDTPATIFVSCGSNRRLFQNVKHIGQKAHTRLTIIPLAFTSDLYQYMQAADLIVGKAGPNSIFEAAATVTPMIVTTHVAGQENGNLDLIREYDIGWVEENPHKATELILSLLANPQQLESKQKQLLKLKKHNEQAKSRLVTLIKSLLINR